MSSSDDEDIHEDGELFVGWGSSEGGSQDDEMARKQSSPSGWGLGSFKLPSLFDFGGDDGKRDMNDNGEKSENENVMTLSHTKEEIEEKINEKIDATHKKNDKGKNQPILGMLVSDKTQHYSDDEFENNKNTEEELQKDCRKNDDDDEMSICEQDIFDTDKQEGNATRAIQRNIEQQQQHQQQHQQPSKNSLQTSDNFSLSGWMSSINLTFQPKGPKKSMDLSKLQYMQQQMHAGEDISSLIMTDTRTTAERRESLQRRSSFNTLNSKADVMERRNSLTQRQASLGSLPKAAAEEEEDKSAAIVERGNSLQGRSSFSGSARQFSMGSFFSAADVQSLNPSTVTTVTTTPAQPAVTPSQVDERKNMYGFTNNAINAKKHNEDDGGSVSTSSSYIMDSDEEKDFKERKLEFEKCKQQDELSDSLFFNSKLSLPEETKKEGRNIISTEDETEKNVENCHDDENANKGDNPVLWSSVTRQLEQLREDNETGIVDESEIKELEDNLKETKLRIACLLTENDYESFKLKQATIDKQWLIDELSKKHGEFADLQLELSMYQTQLQELNQEDDNE